MQKRTFARIAAWVIIILILSACEGGFTTRGSSETSRISPTGAHIEKNIQQAEGAVTQRFDIEYGGQYRVEGMLELEKGAFVIEVLDADESVALRLEATPGQPDSGTALMKTNFGLVRYRVQTEGAEGVHYRLTFKEAE